MWDVGYRMTYNYNISSSVWSRTRDLLPSDDFLCLIFPPSAWRQMNEVIMYVQEHSPSSATEEEVI